jgi:hypothetical protein
MRDLYILSDGFDSVVVLAAYNRKHAINLCTRIVGVRAESWDCDKYTVSDKLRAVREVNAWFYDYCFAACEVNMDIVDCMQYALELIC